MRITRRLTAGSGGGQTWGMGRGSLRIYLGAAPGVGKTYAMLNEGRRRRSRGTDVVIGWVETHGRAATAAEIGDLEVVPAKALDGPTGSYVEMDPDAIIERRPQVVLVDELEHPNAPGARHTKRWRDVQDLLDAGIEVISTLDIAHLESMVDVVQRITGVACQEAVPDEFVSEPSQIELVDATPEALRRRLAHGNIFPPDSMSPSLTNYFRTENLAALRELSLQWMADRVDLAPLSPGEQNLQDPLSESRERIVVGITGAPGTENLIRRAARIAHRARGELIGVHVEPPIPPGRPRVDEASRHRSLVEDLGGRYTGLTGTDVPVALVEFARSEQATQIVLGAVQGRRSTTLGRASVIDRVVRSAGRIDVHVVSHDPSPKTGARARRRLGVFGDLLGAHRTGSHPASRQRIAVWILVAAGLPLLTMTLTHLRNRVTLSSDLLIYLLFVVVTAAVGGAMPALVAAVGATLLVNWFFTAPLHTLTIARGSDVLALVVYLATAGIVSTLVSIAARRSAEAGRANSEAETLAAVAGRVVESDPLPELMAHLRQVFGLSGVSLLRNVEGRWVTETAVGQAPTDPRSAAETHDLDDGLVLALSGTGLAANDRRVLKVFTANLAAALERRRLHATAAEANALAEANQLRAALLQAVSHDLRTPLASIKASASSLRQGDITWTPAESSEFLATIEDETDRLTNLVANLLDMSRINAHALTPTISPTPVDAVVAAALAGLGNKAKTIHVDVPESTPAVAVDPALLERVVANLVDNALTYAPESPVRIDAGRAGDAVMLRVVDTGPGIPISQRDRIFEAFQRVDDSTGPNRSGIGLGLAVARGFSRAMGVSLSVEDTPGGGVTMVLTIPTTEAGTSG